MSLWTTHGVTAAFLTLNWHLQKRVDCWFFFIFPSCLSVSSLHVAHSGETEEGNRAAGTEFETSPSWLLASLLFHQRVLTACLTSVWMNTGKSTKVWKLWYTCAPPGPCLYSSGLYLRTDCLGAHPLPCKVRTQCRCIRLPSPTCNGHRASWIYDLYLLLREWHQLSHLDNNAEGTSSSFPERGTLDEFLHLRRL